MKIQGSVPRVQSTYDKQRNIGKIEKSSSVSGKKDDITISNKAKDFQSVMRALKDTPDVRNDKLEELTPKYESGNYNISGEKIMGKFTK